MKSTVDNLKPEEIEKAKEVFKKALEGS